jgi:hypothetical protein
MRGRLGCGVLVAIALLTFAACGAGASETSSAATLGACGRIARAPAAYRHVIWIWMENHAYDAVIGSKDAPFANALARDCGLATNYHNVAHPSLPNYIAATSGGTQGISDDCEPVDCSRSVQSLFGQVAAAGMSWSAYAESMPSACDLHGGSGSSPSGDYAPKHNPAVYYLPLRPACERRVLPLGTPSAGPLARALRTRGLARFSFITPNLCNDTHDCPVSTGDAWLARWLRAIVTSPPYRDGRTAVFITWDEGEGGSAGDCALDTSDPGCHVPLLVVSPSTRPGTRSGLLFNHYALLRTTEELLGITTYLGHARDASTRSMSPVFRLSPAP